jgi:hypothetical protein
MHEFSVSTNGRYTLKEKNIDKEKNTVVLVYEKLTHTLPAVDSVNRWSFGIITNGKKNKQVCEIVESIKAQSIPEYEILICGPCPDEKYVHEKTIKIIEDITVSGELRAPITKKKNAIFNDAKFNNICIVHDRYWFPEDWFENVKKYGNYFDLLTMPNLSKKNCRVFDWGVHTGLPSEIVGEIKRVMRYKDWSNDWYAQGGLIIAKKHFFKTEFLDENLFWGELEDVQFSKICNLKGLFFYIDVNNHIYTDPFRLGEIKKDPASVFSLTKSLLFTLKKMTQQWYRLNKNIKNKKYRN